MPCMCWYDPPESSKKFIKNCCVMIVEEVIRLQKEGDPLGCEIHDIHTLIDHLYNPKNCDKSGNK